MNNLTIIPSYLLIGQRLNSGGSREVAEALRRRDAASIARIAREQEQAGAQYLDIHAVGDATSETEALRWLVETVQEAADVSLCLDSLNPVALKSIVPLCRRTPILNGFSGAIADSAEWLALICACPEVTVVAACYDRRGTRTTAHQRLEIAEELVKTLKARGVGERQLILDPVTVPFVCGEEALNVTLETMGRLRLNFPEARVLGVPGNYSYDLSRRRKEEQKYIEKARQAGADAFLCDVRVLHERLKTTRQSPFDTLSCS